MRVNRATCPSVLPLKKVAGLAVMFLAAGAFAQSNEFRALWVDAWGTGFLNTGQVTQLIADCRAYHFNAIVVQMRRRGDSFYTPGIAGNDPKTTAIAAGYDALQEVINQAHSGSPRIEVHCWVTTHVIWSSTTPPAQVGHVFNLHPEYLMKDSTGTNFISEGYYLDPGNPDATLWNYTMATNIIRRYDVDGFNWDYIRYPTTDSGYNPTAIARYNAEFGLTGQPSPSSAQFADWRRRQVTDFLRWVNADMLSYRSNLVISCDVFGSRSDAYNARFQDWAAWNNEGLLDICMPMGYTSDNAGIFQPRVDDAFSHQGVRRVYNGQGAYLNPAANTVVQLNYIRNKPLPGSVLYSYRTPNSGTPDIPGTLACIRDSHQPTWVDVPTIPWKATPTKGIVKGTVMRSDNGAAIYNATVKIFTSPNRTQRTEPHGKFAFFETTPGTYTVTATGTALGSVTNTVTIAAGGNASVNLVVPATDNSPPVISNVSADSLTDTSAVISWTTDENANSTVNYGPTASYGSVTSDTMQTVNHSLTLTNLVPNTTYHFRVRSRNPANLASASGDATFLTNPSGVVSDIIVDDSDPEAVTSGSWTTSSSSPGYYGTGYRYDGIGTGAEYVTFRPDILVAGNYKVYLWYVQGSNRTTDAPHIVQVNGGSLMLTVNQQINGSQWHLLGTFKFSAGTNGYVRVTDGFTTGNVVMADAVKFVYVPPPAPPTITNQPSGRAVNQGANATFTVGVSGTMPLSYQWRFEGTNLADATASSYTRSNCQPGHEGDYEVVVTNLAGTATSSVAFLIVNLPPYIGVQPQSQSVKAGEDATFFVAVGGTEPFSYQWQFKGTNLAGATASSYTRSNSQTNDSGHYSVVVTNIAGSVSSSNAMLTVTRSLPLKFQSVERLLNGRLRLVMVGEPGTGGWLDRTSNLVDWLQLTNLVNPNGTIEYVDDQAADFERGFYRTRQ